MSEVIEIAEPLGARYEHALIEIDLPGVGAVRDEASGRTFALQTVARTGFDADGGKTVTLALVDVEPRQTLHLRPAGDGAKPDGHKPAILVSTTADGAVIANGDRSVMLPAPGLYAPPYPGPIAGLRLEDGDWCGSSTLTGAPGFASVLVEIDSVGPCLAQWRVIYRWGSCSHTFLARWAAGSDTLMIEEESTTDTDAAIEWLPLGYHPDPQPKRKSSPQPSPKREAGLTLAYQWGGGEARGPMRPIRFPEGKPPLHGRRILNWLSHISYFNQWNLGWCGFAAEGDDRFAGVFTGWSHAWRRRGWVRPEIIEDDDLGALLRLPVRRGRRLWGLTFCPRDQSGVDLLPGPPRKGEGDKLEPRCILNRRKTLLADLPLSKTSAWDLDPPLEARDLRLLRQEDFDDMRERLALDPAVPAAIDRYLAAGPAPSIGPPAAAAIWAGDRDFIARCARATADWARVTQAEMIDGGYERIIIFDGRTGKRLAWDVDAYWHLGAISESDYRDIRRALLALAYIFVDPDYCRYEDFWHSLDAPDEGIDVAMRDDMGDCPVPPNFASEFFTTTAVAAELYPAQRERDAWRAETTRLMSLFLDVYYEPDGTYLESMNYHNHGFNEMLCQLYAQDLHGVRDWFADPKVVGSFEHFARVRLPEVTNAVTHPEVATGRLAEPDRPRRSPLPANGNSGSNGFEQEYGGQLGLGAWMYRDRNPQLAGELMAAWRENGKPLLDYDHTLLTLVTLDPSIESIAPPVASFHRQSLGVFSRAVRPNLRFRFDGGREEDPARGGEGDDIWALFRCGRCTHHMDFDQGHLHLAAMGRVMLGDHGYHTHDNADKHIGGAHTWLHSTVVYHADRWMSSGYTGLEKAPEPALVRLGDDFDYVCHRIVNDNLRKMDVYSYRQQLPAPVTVHVRRYLFVKPDYFVIWDTFEKPPASTTFWLHPHEPVTALGGGAFRAAPLPNPPLKREGEPLPGPPLKREGEPLPGPPLKREGESVGPSLLIQFVLPAKPDVAASEPYGPLWSFAIRQTGGAPYLAVLHPQREPKPLSAILSADGRTLRVTGDGFDDEIAFPPDPLPSPPRNGKGGEYGVPTLRRNAGS